MQGNKNVLATSIVTQHVEKAFLFVEATLKAIGQLLLKAYIVIANKPSTVHGNYML